MIPICYYLVADMSPMDLLALTSELEAAKLEIISQRQKIQGPEEGIKMLTKPRPFSIEAVKGSESKIKNLFQLYTGLTYVRFF